MTQAKGLTWRICDQSSANLFRQWLQQLDGVYGANLNGLDPFQRIRSLALPFYDDSPKVPGNPISNQLWLMQELPNLNHLSIKFHVEAFKTYTEDVSDFFTHSLEQVCREYNLGVLLKLKELKTMNLSGLGFTGSDAWLPLHQIHKWLQREFDAQFSRKERHSRVVVKMFGRGGIYLKDCWKELEFNQRLRSSWMLKSRTSWIGEEDIPCLGFVHHE